MLSEAWFHCKVADELWEKMCQRSADFRFVCTIEDQLVATFNSAPILWDEDSFSDLSDRGWEWAFERSVQNIVDNPTAVCGFSMNILPEFRGRNLSSQILNAAKKALHAKGIQYLMIPVRPTLKSKYPLIPMEEYFLETIRWAGF